MKVSIECCYCGHKWTEIIFNKSALEDKTCVNGTCKDKKLIIKDVNSQIDYYKGCPEFPEKKRDYRWE